MTLTVRIRHFRYHFRRSMELNIDSILAGSGIRPLITKKTPKNTPKPSPTSTTSDPDRLSSERHQSAFNGMAEEEQFQRISGKRKRGSQDIQIIDVNVDDYLDLSDSLVKRLYEESAYQPHRKKDNLPSSQQRRKKQITYLAFQAKERELELKNQWSQNRMTKNQSRSKYGF